MPEFAAGKTLVILTSSLLLLGQQARGATIFSDANDGFIEVRDTLPPTSPWPQVHGDTFGNFRAAIGEWYGAGLTAAVLPFQLPDFGAVANPFTSADFGVMLFQTGGGTTVTDIDLYAVRTDASPLIATTDYYNGSAIDSSATLIQESFLTPASPVGFVGAPNNNTDAGGDAALLSYLNDAYDGGNGAGQYVFLRLSYAGDDFATAYDGYSITLREAGQEGEWPVINYNAVPEPAAASLCALGSLIWLGRRSRGKLAAA